MTPRNPHPEPVGTPGPEPGGGVPPGETPPAESSAPWAGPLKSPNAPTGWAAVPLEVVMLVVGLCAAGALGYAFAFAQ